MISTLVHALYVSVEINTGKTRTDNMHSYSILDGLALAGNAPKIFARTNKSGLPYISIIFCSLFALLAYMGVKSGSGKVFGWFQNLTSIAGLMTWFGIAVTYIRFNKGWRAQGLDRSTLPYASKLQPFAAWYAAISCVVICFVSLSIQQRSAICL